MIHFLTLLSLFFGANPQTYFLIDEIENSSRKVIEDKVKRKEVKAIMRSNKKAAKPFIRENKRLKKKFRKDWLNTELETAHFDDFYKKQSENHDQLLDLIIKTRNEVKSHINENEWALIVAAYNQNRQDNAAKEQVRIGKRGDVWAQIEASIDEVVIDKRDNEFIKVELKVMSRQLETVSKNLIKGNVTENDNRLNYNFSEEELQRLGEEIKVAREKTFTALMWFRTHVKNRLDEKQWKTIMKTTRKSMNL